MEAPVWTQAMSVGEAHIDAQHQALFEAAGTLLRALREGQPETALQEALAFLRRYTLRHFVTEEALLEDAGYAGLAGHRAAHAELSFAFLDLEARAARFGVQAEAPGVQRFIQRILDHIQENDAEYVPCLQPKPGLSPGEGQTEESMGLASLDEEHASFLAILDQLQDSIRLGHGDDAFPSLLETLQGHATKHFRREELLMQLVDFPTRSEHIRSHADLMNYFVDVMARTQQRKVGLPQETMAFLRAWLKDHHDTHDLAMAPFLQNLGRI